MCIQRAGGAAGPSPMKWLWDEKRDGRWEMGDGENKGRVDDDICTNTRRLLDKKSLR
jgi:hypothetical protein